MGLLRDAASEALTPRTVQHAGSLHRLPRLMESMSPEVRDEFREMMSDQSIDCRTIVRAVYAVCPDAPYHPMPTWWTWRREWLEGRTF